MKYNMVLYNLSECFLVRNKNSLANTKIQSLLNDKLLDLLVLKMMIAYINSDDVTGQIKLTINNDDDNELFEMINNRDVFEYSYNYGINIIKKDNYIYELIWDYASYYNHFNLTLDGLDDISDSKKTELGNALETFRSLPSEYRNFVIEALIKEIKLEKDVHLKDMANKECLMSGHKFTGWEKYHTTTRELDLDDYPQTYKNVERDVWKRTCSHCGFTDVANENPMIIDIKKLKRR